MKIAKKDNKDYVLCPFRRRWVRLTPEEWVRQNFLLRLETNYAYPHSLIMVEARVGIGAKRFDALVLSRDLNPLVLIEFKREDVTLSQAVMDQAVSYNRSFNVPYLMICNGPTTIVAHITDSGVEFLDNIPLWTQL